MTLAIAINEIRPGEWGYTQVGGWPHPVHQRLGVDQQGTYLLWTLDATTGRGRNQYGQSVALAPFMGIMGMPPDEPELHSTVPPRVTGGNMDCKLLTAGSTLYLPIAVPGGRFSVSDGHAAQGDGEVCVTAIECPMAVVDLTFHLHEQLQIKTPRAQTPAGWFTFGIHADLHEASMIAVDAMLDLLGELYGMDRYHALAMASVVVDLRITQLVNQVCGVHALLPYGAFQSE